MITYCLAGNQSADAAVSLLAASNCTSPRAAGSDFQKLIWETCRLPQPFSGPYGNITGKMQVGLPARSNVADAYMKLIEERLALK